MFGYCYFVIILAIEDLVIQEISANIIAYVWNIIRIKKSYPRYHSLTCFYKNTQGN